MATLRLPISISFIATADATNRSVGNVNFPTLFLTLITAGEETIDPNALRLQWSDKQGKQIAVCVA